MLAASSGGCYVAGGVFVSNKVTEMLYLSVFKQFRTQSRFTLLQELP